MHNQNLGKAGEHFAIEYLQSKGHNIVKTNFHCKYGEIDIISVDYSTDKATLAFTEVKARKSKRFGSATEAVDKTKLKKIIKSALCFLNSSSENLPFCWRIDIIGLQLNSSNRVEEIHYLKNIFYG